MSPATWLDGFAASVLERYGYRFTVAAAEAERATAYHVRYLAAVHQGLPLGEEQADGLERDRYDDHAVAIVGWDGDTPIAAGRLVLPPGPLPTEEVCGVRVEPRGEVVDVGRMAVVPDYQNYRHAAFIALLARLYLEMRGRGYEVACGIMSPLARTLLRQLGVQVEVLAAERPYWGEPRAPVRFTVAANQDSVPERWPS